MKLICFSNNTAGGLLCNLLNKNFDLEKHHQFTYRVSSQHHEEFKVGDSPTIQKDLDLTLWNKKIEDWGSDTSWVCTHAHPSIIPDLSVFEEIIAITTLTRTSQLYRWLRYYHGWFKIADPTWIESNNITPIDKVRYLAYNVFEPFEAHPLCKNIEFEDIVSGKFVQENNLDQEYFNEWKQRNPWLYPVEQNSWAVKRFNEAEYEILYNTPYEYI